MVGHVFNLWHILTKPNFMAQSQTGAVMPVGFVFDAARALSRASRAAASGDAGR
jgi:hypothetical protein